MKKILLFAVAIVMCASLASAQSGGHIGLYSDSPGYSDCNLNQVVDYVNPNLVYVVHTSAVQSNTSQFALVQDLTGGTIIAGAPNFGGNLILGDLFTGITVTYVGCKPLPHLLATLSYTVIVPQAACTVMLEVVPDPNLASGQIEIVDCDSNPLFGTGGKLTVNGDESCPCIVATEPTSWSRVKALYQ